MWCWWNVVFVNELWKVKYIYFGKGGTGYIRKHSYQSENARNREVGSVFIYADQCCGSMTFWCGSGSADPCLWLRDPYPAIFVIDLQDGNKKLIFFSKFFCLLLFESTFTSFFRDKKSKRSQNAVGIKVFLTIFCMMIEGSGSVSGSTPPTNRSRSRRPKTHTVLIRRIWIRILNTDADGFWLHPSADPSL